jgi:hypothetical protein
MGSTPEKKKVVVVTGDVTMDWHLTHSLVIKNTRDWQEWQEWQEWNPEYETQMHWERGGAARLADLIEKLITKARKTGEVEIRKVKAPEEAEEVSPTDPQYHHSFALWSSFKIEDHDAKKEKEVWRVSKFLGLEKRDGSTAKAPEFWPARNGDDIRLVVIDDAAKEFREQDPSSWLDQLKGRKDYWIILKMAHPVAKGKLWDYLYQHNASRLIVVVPVNDLRRTKVRISRQLSWERTVQDLVWELTYNPKITALCRCAHVVISFESAGTFWYARNFSPKAKSSRKTLFFLPHMMEGVWGRDHRGGLIGFTSCLVASLAWQVIKQPEKPDLIKGISSGLLAMRKLYYSGYEGEVPDKLTTLKFPFDTVTTALLKKADIPRAEVKPPSSFKTKPGIWDPPVETEPWTILQENYKGNLSPVAQQIVKNGLRNALKDIPIGQFEDLTTVDRQEIESFRSIRNLIREYYCNFRLTVPLSIAVFGPPGSGKSFGILQVARSIFKERIEKKEFNLSQFNRPEELYGAFHQIRDLGLAGKLPLVFWDEFDTALEKRPLGWLRYFLAPMQDGAFQEGQITHPIGRAIFVFGGGTSPTMEEFASKAFSEDEGIQKEFRDVKGPDFVSRIKAHVDIKGVNRPKVQKGRPLIADPYFIIRRAVVLRFLLKRHWGMLFKKIEEREELSIDDGVLKAFLEIEEYKHGVRSMETIIITSLLQNQSHYERSCLPPEEQLDLHVNAADFLDLVHEIVL